MAKILVIEDDSSVLKTVSRHLEFEHHIVESVDNGNDGLGRMRAYTYDVVIVDWNLPDLSGVEICRKYRATGGNALMLMLTCNAKLTEKEEGLDAGFDDYLVKPFDVGELSARIRALLRRASSRLASEVVKIGTVSLDRSTFQVTCAGENLKLVPKEFAVLEYLMRHPHMVFSCDALMSRVWTADEESSPDTIRTHIMNLRKKLEQAGEPQMIKTVHGVGYKLVPPNKA
jgi:DNA-binding response OmpR family regulator